MKTAEYEEKFIVLNKKHINEYLKAWKKNPKTKNAFRENLIVKSIYNILIAFKEDYEFQTGKELNQEYIICNKDEPYAEDVLKVILEGENKKETP